MWGYTVTGSVTGSGTGYGTLIGGYVKITINDIAEMTNFSKATISRVLNAKPDVSEQARKKVMEVIAKHNYNPSSVARGLALNKTHTIGLILPDITNPFFPELARGVENKAKEYGYSVILSDINNDNSELPGTVTILRNKQVDGIVIVQWSNAFSKEIEEVLDDDAFPLVAIDRDDGTSYVNFNNVASSRMAVSYLIKQGHKRIAHITGDLKTLSGTNRYKGYCSSLADHAIPFDDSLVYEGTYIQQTGYKGPHQIMKSKERPTAIFAANDMIAIGIYDAAAEMGINIPEELSVIGHDDISFASILRPKLTTVVVPRYELGVSCMEALYKMMNSGNGEPDTYLLEPKLAIRDSVKVLA